jgi:LysR family glycine cleavage system transcriptional activator
MAQGVDIGVRYGAGHWPGVVAEKLMDEEIYPVCSPVLHKRLRNPADLSAQTLIHDLSMDERQGFPSWSEWLRSAGAPATSAGRGMRINNSAAVLQAAIDGRGIALARSILARDDLAAGRLVRLFPRIDHKSALAYHVVYRADGLRLPKIAAFRDWLFQQAALL